MKIQSLRLEPFGSHEKTALSFEKKNALHLVYGPNEAGKSTTRRAIVALLYGIDERTPDGHRFGNPNLRIFANVDDGAGHSLSVVRRKGRKATLTDDAHQPIDEGKWARLLGGVSREAYEHAFGLDRDLLREGAQTLLAGGADFGESLYQATAGTVNLGKFRQRLDEEAIEIFSDKARKKSLNLALSTYAAKKKEARELGLSSESYEGQAKGLTETEAERDSKGREKAALIEERAAIERRLDSAKLFARKRVLAQKLVAIGEVPHVSEESARARANAEEILDGTSHALERLEHDTEELDAERRRWEAEIEKSAPLAGVDADDYQRRRGQTSSQRSETHDLAGQLAVAEQHAAGLRKSLGAAAQLSTSEGLEELASAIAPLARAPGKWVERTAQERVHIARITKEQNELGAQEVAPQESFDLAAARAAIVDAEAAIDAAAKLPALRDRLDTTKRAFETDAKLADAIAPDDQTMAELDEEHGALARAILSLESERAEVRDRIARIQTELGALTESFAPPLEDDLMQARRARDALAMELTRESLERLRERIAAADAIVDRMRREAERVNTRARLGAELAAETARLAAADQAATRLETARADFRARFSAAWSGVDAPARESARALAARIANAKELAAERASIGTELDRLERESARAKDRLHAILGPVEGSLRALVAVVRERIVAAESARDRIRDGEKRSRALTTDLAHHVSALHEAQDALTAHKESWAIAMKKLGLAPDAAEESAMKRLGELRELVDTEREVGAIRSRLGASRAKIADFDALVMRLAEAIGLPEEADAEQRALAVGRKLRAYDDAAHALVKCTELLRVKATELEALRARRENATATIDLALRAAKVSSREELPAVEARSRERQAIEREILDLDLRIGESGGDPSSPLSDASFRELEERLPIVLSEIERLEREIPQIDRTIGGFRKGLDDMERAETMALASAADAEHELAKIRELSARWARLVVANMLLADRIELHRSENEGHVVGRASTILSKITGGEFVALRPSYDGDTPELLCVRKDRRETTVAGLSAGTKDQFYLSLRIASIERLVETGVTLPVLLDDVLTEFDDDRAKAALPAIADLAKVTQVIFFTHHKHIVDLATETLPKSALSVTTL